MEFITKNLGEGEDMSQSGKVTVCRQAVPVGFLNRLCLTKSPRAVYTINTLCGNSQRRIQEVTVVL